MKPLSAGLTFVNVATVAGLLLGMLAGGLDSGFAELALIAGGAAALVAWIGSSRFAPRRQRVVEALKPDEPRSKRARRKAGLPPLVTSGRERPVWHFWGWIVGVLFALFALRSFCWLLYIDGANLKIQCPNNLGDLGLHLTYINYFANGADLWPDNPIYVFSKLRYPAGTDLFNALLLLAHLDVIHGLVWAGLLGSLATFYGFYRWGGPFGVAGFLCNGGFAGYHFFQTWKFIDYQGEGIAWKSIPLTMFVTQRGLLYAIPAGLLLLLHWRRKYFPEPPNESAPAAARGLIPWWVEWSLYATLPLFHVHTFLALSAVLGCWLVIGTPTMRKQIAILLAAAFLPATGLVYLITDHFGAKSILSWAPGWLQSDPSFSSSIPGFWLVNFGILLPLVLALVGLVGWQKWKVAAEGRNLKARLLLLLPPFSIVLIFALFVLAEHSGFAVRNLPVWIDGLLLALVAFLSWQTLKILRPLRGAVPDTFAFVLPAAAIFLFAIFVKTAPWGWDNTKLIIWAYFIVLPFLWRDLIAPWLWPIRAGVCFLLFASGFVCLIGGLIVGSPGFDIANRLDLNSVAAAVRKIPIKERFAAFPTYNHLLLLDGRKTVLGYPGHLWTQGFDYAPVEQQLKAFMLGAPDWRERARALETRYLFWGDEEQRAYAASAQPWRGAAAVVAEGRWGKIYDLETPVGNGSH
ncbi:MAG: hypothetical protein ACR2MW_10295 [Chthoniobacterales bacterium]